MSDELQPKRRLYRIGDYAHFMGVSTDLLKHYEKLGLIHSETAPNGYRYYSFPQSAALLECMRLHNYDLSLREMHTALHDSSFPEVKDLLDRKINELEDKLRFQQRVIDEHQRLSRWMDMMAEEDTRVIVKDSEPLYFLPHSHQQDFIQDERITALLPHWVSAMPMVKSCRLIPDAASGQLPSWGLIVTQHGLDALHLPINDVVQRIDGGPFVHVHFRHQPHPRHGAMLPPSRIMETLRAYDLKPGCSILLVTLMRMHLEHDSTTCGWFCAPLAAPPAE